MNFLQIKFRIIFFSLVFSCYSSFVLSDEIKELKVPDVIVDEAELLGQTILVPGYMLSMGTDMNYLYDYAGSMTALTIVTESLSKKEKKWILSPCGSGCYVNVLGVVNREETMTAKEVEKMGWTDKLINMAIGEKNLLMN